MSMEGRRLALCAQAPRVVTGIDFVQVVDPTDQRVLRVFFVVEPGDLTPPLVTAVMLGNPNNGAPNIAAELAAVNGGALLPIVRKDWRQVTIDSLTRVCLELEVAAAGGFEPYRLTLRHLPGPGLPDQMDPFLGTVIFDFKQGCETGFDCQDEHDCKGDPGVDFPVDYLARDFESFRRALLDFAAQRHPDWREPIEADMATMLMEVMAQLGDEFAYAQDRVDAETRFASATQRASLAALARLVDYQVDRGRPASGELVLTATAGGGVTVPADAVVWGAAAAETLVPFCIDAAVWAHAVWNDVGVHNPDPAADCLGKGQTSMLLAPGVLPAGATPPDPNVPGSDLPVGEFLPGRRAILLSDPVNAAGGRRAWPVTVTAAEAFDDPLILHGGQPTPVIRIHWAEAEATPFDLPFDGLTVALNIAAVTAGQPVTEYARAGTDDDLATAHPGLPFLVMAKLVDVPRLVEREGPYGADEADGRAVVCRHGLAATEATSLRFLANRPRISVRQLRDPVGFPMPLPTDPAAVLALFPDDPGAPTWTYADDLLTGDLDSPIFTVEPGMWRTVKTHQLPFADVAFRDYASNEGWSVQFGFGDFGVEPADGALFRFRYYTDPGVAANVSRHTIRLAYPLGPPVDPALAPLLDAVNNPLPFGNARAEESFDEVRLKVPHEYRARPRRAVRPEDYALILEQTLPWVQKAHAVTRWTGSWSTDFVAADPRGSIEMTPLQRLELGREIDCIHLVTRDARQVDPDYRDIDLHVRICVAVNFYAGDVIERVRDALAPPGFFAPDRFTFGQALKRSAIEAAVQDVPGVAHVDSIDIRVHGIGDWRPFPEAELAAEPNEIIRLQNDPNRSTLGLLRVSAVGAM